MAASLPDGLDARAGDRGLDELLEVLVRHGLELAAHGDERGQRDVLRGILRALA